MVHTPISNIHTRILNTQAITAQKKKEKKKGYQGANQHHARKQDLIENPRGISIDQAPLTVQPDATWLDEKEGNLDASQALDWIAKKARYASFIFSWAVVDWCFHWRSLHTRKKNMYNMGL